MPISREAVLERATATRGVQAQVAGTWVWDELDVAGWDNFIAALRAAQDTEAATRAAHLAGRGALDTLLDDLEQRKVQGAGVARYRWRDDATNLALVDGLEELGSGRDATISEARSWLKLWSEVEPDWNPTAANTRTAFAALLAQCVQAQDAWTEAHLVWRKAAVEWNNLADRGEDLCVAWYGTAQRIFPAGTVEGDLIRSQIPTFENNAAPEPTPPAAPTS